MGVGALKVGLQVICLTLTPVSQMKKPHLTVGRLRGPSVTYPSGGEEIGGGV